VAKYRFVGIMGRTENFGYIASGAFQVLVNVTFHFRIFTLSDCFWCTFITVTEKGKNFVKRGECPPPPPPPPPPQKQQKHTLSCTLFLS